MTGPVRAPDSKKGVARGAAGYAAADRRSPETTLCFEQGTTAGRAAAFDAEKTKSTCIRLQLAGRSDNSTGTLK